MNYIGSSLQVPYFGIFVSVWIYMRHYLNLRILYSIFTEFRTIGPFELDWAGEQFKCWISQYISFTLLACLQALNLFWLFLILRIAYRLVIYNIAEDDRSDNEEEPEESEKSEKAPLLNGHATNGHAKTNGIANK